MEGELHNERGVEGKNDGEGGLGVGKPTPSPFSVSEPLLASLRVFLIFFFKKGEFFSETAPEGFHHVDLSLV